MKTKIWLVKIISAEFKKTDKNGFNQFLKLFIPFDI